MNDYRWRIGSAVGKLWPFLAAAFVVVTTVPFALVIPPIESATALLPSENFLDAFSADRHAAKTQQSRELKEECRSRRPEALRSAAKKADWRRNSFNRNKLANTTLLPIYWINLERSKDRRELMESSFRLLQIQDQTRIQAVDIPKVTEQLQAGTLELHPNITIELADDVDPTSKHSRNIYEYQEAACLLSHLETIRRAYQDGQEIALILEDDALLSETFTKHWKKYITRAPSDWTILQMATSNPSIIKQGFEMKELFTTWQPNHWTTTAYIINRRGMEQVLNRALTKNGTQKWSVTDLPMVVADEVIYYLAQPGVYTSTKLLLDTVDSRSTVQRKSQHVHFPRHHDSELLEEILQEEISKLPQSLIVLMSMRVRTKQELTAEFARIWHDSRAVCQYHEVCDWEIQLVLVNDSLLETYEQMICDLPDNVHIHVRVLAGHFNKFGHMKKIIPRMKYYDLVVLKDNDMRCAGFPWETFLQRKGDAIMASTLRQVMEESFIFHSELPKRQWMQFYEGNWWAQHWTSSKWAPSRFSSILPVDVPLLEMFFVAMDSRFATYFFNLILNGEISEEFLSSQLDWGPDYLGHAFVRWKCSHRRSPKLLKEILPM